MRTVKLKVRHNEQLFKRRNRTVHRAREKRPGSLEDGRCNVRLRGWLHWFRLFHLVAGEQRIDVNFDVDGNHDADGNNFPSSGPVPHRNNNHPLCLPERQQQQ